MASTPFYPHHPHLRLAGTDEQSTARWLHERRARQEVIGENRAAAQNPTLQPTDPRWVLAVRAYAQLQGSAMTPERRERVLKTAKQLGVRPFDASLVIAIVQDHARRGEDLADAVPTLALMRKPAHRRPLAPWVRWVAAFGCAASITALLILWLLS